MASPQQALQLISKRYDILVVAFILSVAGLMILPLPPWIMDLMISMNMTLAVLFLLMAIYLNSPLEFSTLPSAILLATLIRVAITIATSRLILAHGDAGSIVTSFGEFVVAGNVIVGLVIFAIIAVAQFVVITKGAERVAEVTARFTLDALPGKQMSIDGDLRAGDIDRVEARRRRQRLERESQFHGSMDGAMKFVKGDAIVSIIVMLVNLIGGLAIGTMVKGMDLGTAFNTFALLTVGDGLASQLPALLIAVASGIIVTRVGKEDGGNLGADLGLELTSSVSALYIAAAAVTGLALVPGFPSFIFLMIAAVLAGGAWRIQVKSRPAPATAGTTDAPAAAPETPAAEKRTISNFVVRHGLTIDTAVEKRIRAATEAAVRNGDLHYGFELARPRFERDERLAQQAVAIEIDGAPTWSSDIDIQSIFVQASEAAAALVGIDRFSADDLPGLGKGLWVDRGDEAKLKAVEAAVLEGPEALGRVVGEIVCRNAVRSFALQDVDRWLQTKGEDGLALLVDQLRQSVPITRIANVLQLLLEEHVSLSQPHIVLEALLEFAPRVDDNAQLADYVRLALSRPLSAQFATAKRSIGAHVIEQDLEQVLKQGVQKGAKGNQFKLESGAAQQIVDVLARDVVQNVISGPRPVVLTSFALRRPMRRFLTTRGLDIPVLAMEEIAPDYAILPLSPLNLTEIEFTVDE